MTPKVLGINIDPLTKQKVLERIQNFVASGFPHQIATVNPEFLLEAQKNKNFRRTLKETELKVSDGAGIQLAANFENCRFPSWPPVRILMGALYGLGLGLRALFFRSSLKKPVPEIITGVDLVDSLGDMAAKFGWRIFLLGGEKKVAKETALALINKYPSLVVVGAEEGIAHNSKLDWLHPNETIQALIAKIKTLKPHILLVALGAPKQDIFINMYKKDLGVPVMMGVGGAFDFISGRIKRAPKLMRIVGLEWLWRLTIEPWRYKRIIKAVIVFPWKVFWEKMHTPN